jgi:hypothetical protein
MANLKRGYTQFINFAVVPGSIGFYLLVALSSHYSLSSDLRVYTQAGRFRMYGGRLPVDWHEQAHTIAHHNSHFVGNFGNLADDREKLMPWFSNRVVE